MWRRFMPVLSLFLLSPLVAEYLLGSLPVMMIGILPIMAAMYGSGALLVREVARRTGGGWVSIALLGLAYGLIEEGLVTQSLFNPNYLHLRLLDYGFAPALGTGLPWLIYVLSIHMVWSIAVPIGLVEALFPARRTSSWLGWIGIGGFTLLFLAGLTATAGFTYKMLPFMASPGQLAGALIAAALLIAAAIIYPRYRAAPGDRPVPASWILFLLAFVAGATLMAVEHAAPSGHWPWPAAVAALLGIETAFATAMIFATRGRRWTDRQRFALMAGGLAVYGVYGFSIDRSLHGVADLIPHTVVVLLFAVIAYVAFTRTRASATA